MMKNRILTTLTIILLLLSCNGSLFSEQKKFHVSVGIHGSGLWMASNKVIRNVYGTHFYPFGFYFRAGVGENFALEASTDFIFETGTPVSTFGEPLPYAQASMNLTSINITGMAGLSLDGDFSPYLGAGVSTCNFEETITMYGYSESGSWSPVGFHFLIGIQRFWKFFGVKSEIRFMTATFDGWQGKTDVGGFGLYTGFMFRFGF